LNVNLRRFIKGRIEVNGVTNDTAGHAPHLVWNGTVVGEATFNTEASDNTLPALGSSETTITATTKFSVIGAHFAFTYLGANVTFQYSLGEEDSNTFMKLSGAVEFALPCNPGMLGKGKGLFKARMVRRGNNTRHVILAQAPRPHSRRHPPHAWVSGFRVQRFWILSLLASCATQIGWRGQNGIWNFLS
jgi:hypothetical protein